MLHHDSLCGLYLSKAEKRRWRTEAGEEEEEKVWLPGEIKKDVERNLGAGISAELPFSYAV